MRLVTRISTLAMIALLVGCGDGQEPDTKLAFQDTTENTKKIVKPYEIRWMNKEAFSSTTGNVVRFKHYLKLELFSRTDWLQKKIGKKEAEVVMDSAIQGESYAQFLLGTMYYHGFWVLRDLIKAAEWFEKAAMQGLAEAQFEMGMMSLRGEGGLDKDRNKAVAWFEAASVQGYSHAQYCLGILLWGGNDNESQNDVSKAAELLTKAAKNGHNGAKMLLGFMFAEGKGVPADLDAAVKLWTEAAQSIGDDYAYELGWLYARKVELGPDNAQAVYWWKRAAGNGHKGAQQMLGYQYGQGVGVPLDSILAYAWFNLAASDSSDDEAANSAVINREITAQRLSPDEIGEAQRLSSIWKKGHILTRETTTPKVQVSSSSKAPSSHETGTTFVVSESGRAITNNHIVAGCKEIRIAGRDKPAKLITTDVQNDLALIRIPGKWDSVAPIGGEAGMVRQGDEIVVFGFPLNTVLSSGGNLTPGVISALTGLANNTNQYQITAQIQPGSSGSPVLNKKGEVVGVVSMKLDDKKMANATGQVAQNVNFAINGQTLKTFLDAHKVSYRDGVGFFTFGSKSAADLADEARKWTLVVECWK